MFDETIIVTTRTIKKKISSRFSVAVYILSVLSMEDSNLCTSEWITDSVNINPVVIRRVMIMWKRASLVNVITGAGGVYLLKDLAQITLIYIGLLMLFKKEEYFDSMNHQI